MVNTPSSNQTVLRKMDHLFESVHPTQLKNHLTRLLLHYLENEHDALPPDFEDMVTDVRLLLEFLMVVEEGRVD